MKYYERIIKRGYYDTVLYRKNWEGERRKSGYLYLAPTRSLVICRSANQKPDDSGERAQPGTSVWLLYTDDLHFRFVLFTFLEICWEQLLTCGKERVQECTLYVLSSAPMIS